MPWLGPETGNTCYPLLLMGAVQSDELRTCVTGGDILSKDKQSDAFYVHIGHRTVNLLHCQRREEA